MKEPGKVPNNPIIETARGWQPAQRTCERVTERAKEGRH